MHTAHAHTHVHTFREAHSSMHSRDLHNRHLRHPHLLTFIQIWRAIFGEPKPEILWDRATCVIRDTYFTLSLCVVRECAGSSAWHVCACGCVCAVCLYVLCAVSVLCVCCVLCLIICAQQRAHLECGSGNESPRSFDLLEQEDRRVAPRLCVGHTHTHLTYVIHTQHAQQC